MTTHGHTNDGEGPQVLYEKHMEGYAKSTMHLSMTKINHPDYQAILAMGNSAVPFLLRDVRAASHRPDGKFCFWAGVTLLWSIIGKTDGPKVSEQDMGKFDRIQKLWRDWDPAPDSVSQPKENVQNLKANDIAGDGHREQ